DVHYTSAAEATAPPDAEVSGSDPAAGWVDAGHSGTGAWHSIADLTYGTTYRLRVRAANAAGGGPWLHGTKEVPVTAPTAGRALSVVGGSRRLILSWAAPSDTGGAAVSYRAEYTASTTIADDAPRTNNARPGESWVQLRRSADVTSPYTFWNFANNAFIRGRVQAYNSAGSGPWVAAGDTVTATPAPRLTGLSVKVGDTLIVLTPTFDGDHLVYEATVPHDAANVTVTPTWGATGVTVEAASQSPDDGRTAVYTNPTTISSSGSSATLDLARSGDTDAFVTSCKGTVCTSYRIDVSRAPAPPAPPTVPRNVQATPGDGKLTLTWQAPMSWGGRAKAFLVEWKLSSAGDSAWQGVHGGQMAPTATSYEFTGENLNVDLTTHTVANGTAYDLRIKAVNHNRENDDSDWITVSGTPAAQTVAPPSVPRNVQATPGDGKVTLTWQAPSTWGDWPA
ncbi:MAG: cadherin-like beta sandwich domain-containing protein, partial [Gemmatimonadota bacterium]|nr:cadherin-like beta sandwich domain-containing protein [Gemmatimonadota bacterium]